MIERYFETPDDVALLDRWLTTPDEHKEKLPAHLADRLERLTRAYRWLMAHHSRRKVWPMMHAYYTAHGRKYSETTARNDVIDAERLFLHLTPHTGPYITHLMIDSLYEEYHSAKRRGDGNAAVKYARELDRYIERYDRYIAQRDDASRAPVSILAVFDLKEVNIDADPKINEKIEKWRKARQQGSDSNATDADFTVIPDDPDNG